MSSTCTKCTKTVYPVEKLSALGSTWHKGCFKCYECSMSLNLQNYVSSPDKKPYCKAHVPKAGFTVVSETPEAKRIAEVTKNQSNLAYTADFIKDKAQFTVVADTPAMETAKKNTKNQSSVQYNQIRDREPNNLSRTGSNSEVSSNPAPQHVAPQQHAPVSSYVAEPAYATSVTPAVESQNQADSEPRFSYKANFTYAPDADDELTFQVGDIIVDAHLISEGWLMGTHQNTGKTGLFPEPYCQKL